MRMMMTDLRMT